jgi:hypothetical protein
MITNLKDVLSIRAQDMKHNNKNNNILTDRQKIIGPHAKIHYFYNSLINI